MRMRSSNRRTALTLAAAALAGAGLTTMVGGSAEAIPVPQKQCNFNYQTIKAEDGWKPMGMGVTIHNGDSPRKLVAQLAADLGVDTLAEVRVGYQVDGGPVHQDILQQLLEAGADPTITDNDGVTALEHARERGYTAMVALLTAAR